MSDSVLHYDKLVEAALKGVVRNALDIVQKNGLPGAHHFYITFRTEHPDVVIPDYLREQYPDEMTIVLQYQFEDLSVREEFFSVSLSFNNTLEHLTVPFAAVTGFADPSVKFGLQFHVDEGDDDVAEHPASTNRRQSVQKTEVLEQDKPTEVDENNVVSLDQFRKKGSAPKPSKPTA
ncbi:MAG: SspB family protein [Holosporales bacterium]|jgi:hypothetical protein